MITVYLSWPPVVCMDSGMIDCSYVQCSYLLYPYPLIVRISGIICFVN